MRVRRGDDLDAIAVLELGPQRHELVVHLGRDAAVADVGVHRVGEIDRGRAARQRHDLALRREDVDLVREQVDLHVLEELGRVAARVLDLEQRLQPLVRAALHLRQRAALFVLVQPVRRDAGLGDAVHVARADLHLDRHAVRADQRGVQRLVAVQLRDRDVVLELAGHRLVERVQRAEREVARRHVAHDDAEAVDVEHLGEREFLLDHLPVDRVDVLLAAADRRLELRLGEALLDRVEDLVHHLAAVAARALHRLGEHAVAHRVDVLEAELLQLAVEPVEAEAVRDRGVDLERLARDAAALRRRDRVERAHVVQPVGELDQHDAHVARHREQHLAEVLGLRVLLRLELDAVELRDAVDEVGDRLAEALRDVVGRDLGVLDHVVQQRGAQRLRVELPVREDLGDRDRVRDVGFAGLAELALVGRVAEVVGLLEAGEVRGLEIPGDALPEAFERGDCAQAGATARRSRRDV